MRVQRVGDEITIRHLPIANWALGLVTLITILIVSRWLFAGQTYSTFFLDDLVFGLAWVFLFAIVMYLSIFDFVSSSGLLAPATSVRLNKKEAFVEVIETRLYGRRVTRRYFYQMNRFRSYKARRFLSMEYFLSLHLRKGRYLKLLVPLGRSKTETTRLVKELNKFVRES